MSETSRPKGGPGRGERDRESDASACEVLIELVGALLEPVRVKLPAGLRFEALAGQVNAGQPSGRGGHQQLADRTRHRRVVRGVRTAHALIIARVPGTFVFVSTPICKLLGIEEPVVQAPMASAAVPALAAAVSNAGALGTIALTWLADVAGMVQETAGLTDRPFAGNLALERNQHRRLDQALEAGLRIVSLFWGDPSPYVERVHDAGGLVMHTVASAEDGRRAAACGVDVIVAQGWEAGGHVRGRVATLPLVPAVVDAVAPVPVIAAGGIGDGRGVAAVIALGAQAAWVGTRFLLADEAPIHDEYRRLLIESAETEPEWYANLYDVGWPDAPHRALRNSTAEHWERAGSPAPGTRPGEGEEVARQASGEPLVRYSSAMALQGVTGDIGALSLWAGQSVGIVKRRQPAAEIVAELTSRL